MLKEMQSKAAFSQELQRSVMGSYFEELRFANGPIRKGVPAFLWPVLSKALCSHLFIMVDALMSCFWVTFKNPGAGFSTQERIRVVV